MGSSELHYNVSGKHKIRDKIIMELKYRIAAITDQIKNTQNKIKVIESNLNVLINETKLKEKKELTEAKKSVNESTEAAVKTFNVSENNLELEQQTLIDKSFKATIHTLYDVVLFDRFGNEEEIFTD